VRSGRRSCWRTEVPVRTGQNFRNGCGQNFRNSHGESDPEKHISKEGDPYLRRLLVQCAHFILGPFGQDSDLRRWGLRLAERGGKTAKKKAIAPVARKLAVLLHRLWVSGKAYQPIGYGFTADQPLTLTNGDIHQ